jgi:carbamoyltransferase
MAGGVGLNCHTNWVVKQDGPFDQVYIPPAPHDAGTAVGAALHHFHATRPDAPVRSRRGVAGNAFLGPAFDRRRIERALHGRDLSVTRTPRIEREAARLLTEGKVVAWFQDRMEFGPRALGHRSLLADPRDPGIREVLNRKVKHREPFRPFAPSVLRERADDWFVLGGFSDSYAFMSFAAAVRQERLGQIPAVVHADGTARLQLVDRDLNPRFHELIAEFDRRTGVPMVLNTSFNDSEPIVCTPEDAVATLLGTGIDALAIGDYLAKR